jgi:ribokinase
METILTTAEAARAAKVPFLLNPAPAQRLPGKLWKLVHTLIPNEHEAVILSGESQLKKAGAKLLKLGCQRVIITRGARGALVFEAGSVTSFPAPKVKAVDTVGAGDCFAAWLAVGMAEGLSTNASVRRALTAASLSVTRSGAQSAMPYRREIA